MNQTCLGEIRLRRIDFDVFQIPKLQEASVMKLLLFLCSVLILGSALNAAEARRSPHSLSDAVLRQLKGIEKNIVDVAEAMPDDKFNFTPQNLKIAGSSFDGVRTFAEQVKHLATDNYAIWSPVTGDLIPSGIKNVNGPDELKSKAEIIKYLKDSFAEGHKAIATLTAENAMDMLPFRGSKLARLDLVFYALTHANDHYGQMVVYLRMSGIVPPASRPR